MAFPKGVTGTDPGTGQIGVNTTIAGATTGAIGMISNVGIQGISADDVDVTTMNNTQPGGAVQHFKRYISGLVDPGTLDLTLVFEKHVLGTILGAAGANNENWTVAFPDGSTYVQSGHIKSYGMQVPVGDKIAMTVGYRMDGPPTWNTSSSSIVG